MSIPVTEAYGDASGAGDTFRFSGSTTVSEIVEEELEEEGYNSSELFEINYRELEIMPSIKEEEDSSLFSFDVNNNNNNGGGAEDDENSSVYVAVGKSESSMDALSWTLSHLAVNASSTTTTTVVNLIHVFPEIRHIPSPLGMLPKSQVSPAQVESYMEQERVKRRQLLQKFLDICSASKVKVETILIESDMVAKAIVDLIPILNIRMLVVGTSNSRKLKSRKVVAKADQIFRSAPISCEVKVICEGNEVITQMIGSPFPSPSPSPYEENFKVKVLQQQQQQQEEVDERHDDSFVCMCFRPR